MRHWIVITIRRAIWKKYCFNEHEEKIILKHSNHENISDISIIVTQLN